MDATSSLSSPTSTHFEAGVVNYDPSTANELPKEAVVRLVAQPVSLGQTVVDICQNEDQSTHEQIECTSKPSGYVAAINCEVESFGELPRAEEWIDAEEFIEAEGADCNPGVSSRLQVTSCTTKRSGLDLEAGLSGAQEPCSSIKGAGFEKGTNGAQFDASVAGKNLAHKVNLLAYEERCISENFDVEKGSLAQSQTASQESDKVKAGAAGKLDRNGSCGEKVCRVCYLGFEAAQPGSGTAIELGCACKDDLAFAHRQCAEAWFKIKGNRTCEICGSTVHNVIGVGDAAFMENWNDADASTAATSEGARCWQNHRVFNILLACMVFAFVLPWLFHVTSFFT